MPDILADRGALFLGSRLKRLAERLQTDAARVIREGGVDVQPGQYPLLAALDRYGPLTVSQAVEILGVRQPGVTRTLTGLVEEGLLETERTSGDQRQKTIALTSHGRDTITRSRPVWDRIERAVREMTRDLSGSLLDQLAMLEAEHARSSMQERSAAMAHFQALPDAAIGLSIVEYRDDLAADFHRINAEWIGAMFTMEENDRAILERPRELILDRGGIICFVAADGLGIVGACALIRIDARSFELTKMGVLESARGRKAGEFLLREMIARAHAMQVERLYLLTNSACAAAIHLYEKAGFRHDAEIMRDYGARYARCNVAMAYPMDTPNAWERRGARTVPFAIRALSAVPPCG